MAVELLNNVTSRSIESDDKKMLVIDDDGDFQEFIQELFQNFPIQITNAFGAYEAIELVEKNHYDLILLDLLMPNGSGSDFMTLSLSHIFMLPPVIVLSSINDDQLMKNVLSVGASAYLTKPVKPNDLRSTVLKYLKIDGDKLISHS